MPEKSDGVVVSWVRPALLHGNFMECVLNLAYYDRDHHDRLAPGRGGLISQVSSANISGARNAVCLEFLTHHAAPWLLMLDTDMTFQPDILEALLEFADEDKAPIVGGLCFSMDNDGKLFPTLYDVIGTEESPEFVRYHEWKPEAMMQVFATGAACMLIHRNALRAIRDHRDPDRPGQVGFSQAFPWFQETDFYGRPMGEDITFCLRAGRAGLPVFVNTAVQLGHIKQFELNIDHFVGQRALEEAKAAVGDVAA
jgi:hypothetical protein